MNAFRLLSQTELQTIRNKNVRVHFLDASSQKDGPSAGTAETLALLSLYKNTVIDSRLAMTGEISLNGDVCQIGTYIVNIGYLYLRRSISQSDCCQNTQYR
jgi:ATP-dependent Lon protease